MKGNEAIRIDQTGHKVPQIRRVEKGCDSRLSVALGTRGFSSRLSSSHFDVGGWFEKVERVS